MTEGKTNRRRFRFSLRSAFVAVAMICIVLAAIASSYQRRYQKEQQLRNRLEAGGASAAVEMQMPGWLRWIGPSKYFERVTTVTWWPIDKIDLDESRQFESLREISLSAPESKFTDDFVAKLASMKTIHLIYVEFTFDDLNSSENLEHASAFMKNLMVRLPRVQVGGSASLLKTAQ